MSTLDPTFFNHLSANSAEYRDPLTQLPWDALSLVDFWLPPSALSLAGLSAFEQQTEAVQRRLSQYEFIHFTQAGLWLEGIFIERLSRSLSKTQSHAETAYNLHEIREESGHSLMFLKLMEQSGLHLPTNNFRPPWLARMLSRHASTHSPLFWLAVVIGEEIPDWLNRHVQNHRATINPLITAMCRLHIIDEARHIARSRRSLEQQLHTQSIFKRYLLNGVAQALLQQFVRAFYLPSPAIYELAGLSPGDKWHKLALHNPTRQNFLEQCTRPTVHRLAQSGFHIK